MCRVEYADDLLSIEELGFELPGNMPVNPLLAGEKDDKIKNDFSLIGYKVSADFEGKMI